MSHSLQPPSPLRRNATATRHPKDGASTLLHAVVGERGYNLPAQPTALIGRQQELAAARESLLTADVHLLTLTGGPGIGKTRLAIEVAADLQDEFAQGACFVDLATIGDSALVGTAIAQAIAIRE